MQQGFVAAKIISITERIGRIVESICGAFCVACFAAMTLVAILGVFFRYVMQSPFMWTEEIARYLMVWMGFTAISIALKQNRHIKVEVLPKMFPPMAVKVASYVVDAMIALFFIVLLGQGYLMTVNNIMTASTFRLSMSWVLVAVPLAAALTLIQLFVKIVKKVFSEFISEPGPTA